MSSSCSEEEDEGSSQPDSPERKKPKTVEDLLNADSNSDSESEDESEKSRTCSDQGDADEYLLKPADPSGGFVVKTKLMQALDCDGAESEAENSFAELEDEFESSTEEEEEESPSEDECDETEIDSPESPVKMKKTLNINAVKKSIFEQIEEQKNEKPKK